MTGFLILGVTLFLSLAMMLAWEIQRRTRNAGWVDVVWSFALGIAGVAYALAPVQGQEWPSARQLIVAVLAGAWSLRLGLHIAARTRHGKEDSRYARFREEWGEGFDRRMFGFLQIQAAAAAFLALAMLLAARNPAPLGWQDGLAVLVLAIAVAGEGLADEQMRRFRADPANKGKVNDKGLWGLSRHPNYFFEWLGWFAWPLFAVSALHPWGWLALAQPAFMYWLLVHVSGIPPLEAEMARSRGAAWDDYCARTRPFLPFPKVRSR
ncbi:DUF1295 domain-containing protein [Acetobacteraceae bacterium H6797]|nr:DUF1295 domain-containing protein [Acetobacteraceae bacterium H6797]